MNRTNFEHAIYALLMQIVIGLLTGNWWTGAAFGAAFCVAFFLGREHAQAQAKIGDPGLRGDIAAFKIWKWSLDAHHR
jgi:hypothetical protein